MSKTLIIALVAFINFGCETVFKPELNPSRWAASDDAGHFTDDAGRRWVRGEHNCFVDSECPPGQQCVDREWCYTPVEEEGDVISGEWPGDPEGEGDGEGEHSWAVEGEGEDRPPDGEGEGSVPSEGEGEGSPPAGEGEGEEPEPCIPEAELCDGLDNDCDGETDDGFGEISCGQGPCRVQIPRCINGVTSDICIPLDPTPELCDGLDNDCDGETDEGLGQTTCGQHGCSVTAENCLNGRQQVCVPMEPSPELCDGLDNDCDGETDENAAPAGWSCIPPTGPRGFRMGGAPNQVTIILTYAFLMKRTEVTQGEWQEVMGYNPSSFRMNGSEGHPVETMSFFEALEFANARSRAEGLPECYIAEGLNRVRFTGLDCTGYRLPTEAEWEYAARAGTQGDLYGALQEIAWYRDNSGQTTHPVGGRLPNAWGLYDTIGNVWEWLWPPLGGPLADATDPVGPEEGQGRIIRGCSWGNIDGDCNVHGRWQNPPAEPRRDMGFRLVRRVE